jgi:uncharacterized membrane protein YbhN (UPF0104 family)
MYIGNRRGFGARIWHLWPVAALGAGVWILAKRLEGVELSHVLDAVLAVSPLGWVGAIAATWLSLAAVGQYDAIRHRVLNTGISPKIARRTGLIAISIAQTAGFGTLVSASVRWRSLPNWSLWEAARFSLRVSFSFLLLWSLLAALAVAFWTAAPKTAVWAAAGGLIVFGIVAGAPPLRGLVFKLIPKRAFLPLFTRRLSTRFLPRSPSPAYCPALRTSGWRSIRSICSPSAQPSRPAHRADSARLSSSFSPFCHTPTKPL